MIIVIIVIITIIIVITTINNINTTDTTTTTTTTTNNNTNNKLNIIIGRLIDPRGSGVQVLREELVSPASCVAFYALCIYIYIYTHICVYTQ